MEEKIILKRSRDADTRSAESEVTKKQLLQNSVSHINDVQNVGNMIADKFKEQLKNHDWTKIEYIDKFHKDFNDVKRDESKSFKDMEWFNLHINEERHHLNDSVPDDVNLIDVLEMVVDCCCAGLARSGNIYPIEIPQEVIQKAIDNTKELIIQNTKVEE